MPVISPAPTEGHTSSTLLDSPSDHTAPGYTTSDLPAAGGDVDQAQVEEYCRSYYNRAIAYARRLRKSSASLQDRIDLGDTESAAGVGLLRAASAYEPSQGPFEPWMRRHVRYEVWEAARQATMVPRSVMDKLKELRSAEVHLEASFGRPATPPEVADHLGIDLSALGTLYELRNTAREPSEIENASVASASDADEDSALVSEAMAAFGPLSGDERVVLALHYMEGIPFREVARILDKRPDAVSRIHGRAKSVASDFLAQLAAEA